MAEEDSITVVLRDDFYRDGFGKVIISLVIVGITIISLIALSIYLYLSKPNPIYFPVDQEWRVQAPVPLDQPYLSKPDLLEWVSNTISKVWVYDFDHYNDQLKQSTHYFTADGWKVFLNQLNIYANYTTVQKNKMFVNDRLLGAPTILRQGLLPGRRYAWWIQVPILISYAGYNLSSSDTLTLQVLVVRVSTLNNLMGVGIDNMIVAKTTKGRQVGNG